MVTVSHSNKAAVLVLLLSILLSAEAVSLQKAEAVSLQKAEAVSLQKANAIDIEYCHSCTYYSRVAN